MTDRDLLRLRRGAHEFLRRHAARAWAHENEHGRWEITLPPDVAALPRHKRFKKHARQEARRLATAQLFDLDAKITARAVRLGATIGQEQHGDASALTGHDHRSAVLPGIQPPAVSGFLRWQDGIGYNGLGAPVLACHWGPALGESARWLAWWADGDAMTTAYTAQAQAAGQRIDAGSMTQIFGPLWYDHQIMQLRPHASSIRFASGNPAPELLTRAAGESAAEAGTPGRVLLATTLATWRLLTRPDAGVHLSQQPMPADEQDADRAAGLPTRSVIVATAAGTT
ncbi:MAG: hypothetical protein ACRDNF_06815 [Streptosporangiaceae bacterium]